MTADGRFPHQPEGFNLRRTAFVPGSRPTNGKYLPTRNMADDCIVPHRPVKMPAFSKEEISMKYLIAATAIAAAFAVKPASAKMMSCSGDGMMKVNSMGGTMADGPNKMMMMKEVGMANTSMSKGDMRGCNMHLMKAQKMGMMK
jgi:phosphopantetheinyl transferase (holo-ACP synthase)